MNGILAISAPASARGLLSVAQLRAAAGVTDNSRDTELADLGVRVADMVADFCRVAGDGVNPATLLSETAIETFRLDCSMSSLVLARRFVTAISTVVEDGTTLDADDYEVDAGAGLLYRLEDDRRSWWPSGKIVVTYTAGFASPPSALVSAATRLVQLDLSQTSRDPLVRSERVRTEGVEEIQTDYWVGPVNGAAIPADVADILAPYMTRAMG